jgi:hypothetical protein
MPVPVITDPFFDEQAFSQPATLTLPDATTREIDVILDRDYQDSEIGDTQVTNGRPVAQVREVDVQDVGTGSTLAVHDYLEDDNGNPLLGDDGDVLVADNVATYKIIRVRRTNDGTALLDLRQD